MQRKTVTKAKLKVQVTVATVQKTVSMPRNTKATVQKMGQPTKLKQRVMSKKTKIKNKSKLILNKKMKMVKQLLLKVEFY